MLSKVERAAIVVGGVAGEVFLEIGRMVVSIPILQKAATYAPCSKLGFIPLSNLTCAGYSVAAANSQLSAVTIPFIVGELAILAGLVLFWWRYVRS